MGVKSSGHPLLRLPACEPRSPRAGMPIPQGGYTPESLLVPWAKTGRGDGWGFQGVEVQNPKRHKTQFNVIDAESAIYGLNPVTSPSGALAAHLQNGDQATFPAKELDHF